MILILFMLLNAGFMEIFEEFRQLFDAFNWDVASKCQGFDGETLPLFKTVKDWAMNQGFIKVSLEKQSILSDDASTVWWRPPVMDTQIHRSFVIRCITVYLMIVYPPIKLENREFFFRHFDDFPLEITGYLLPAVRLDSVESTAM